MGTAQALPIVQNTPSWVDARRDVIGSSDLPILSGNTPYGTSVFSLWALKTRLAEPEPVDPDTQELYDLGHALEDDIAERYELKEGRVVRRVNRMLVRKDLAWASASLDRVSAVRGERRIVECKWVPYRRWLDDGPEPVPAYVQDQVQWQLFVTGYDVADVAVLLGAKVYVYEIGPDERYQADLVYIAKWFRELVTKGTPPPVDGSEATRKALTRLHPSVAIPDVLPPTAESDAVAGDLFEAKRALRAAELREGELSNALRSLIGDHMGVEGEGYRATWTKNADSSKTDWQKVAQNQRKILEGLEQEVAGKTLHLVAAPDVQLPSPVSMPELLDAIEALHSATREGARVLRVSFRDEEGRARKWV